MIECPKCNRNISGTKCSCGYELKNKFTGPTYVHLDHAKDDADMTRNSQVWLIQKGICDATMSSDKWQAATREYRLGLKNKPLPDSLAWARNLLQLMEDGENISLIQERMAKQALGIPL